MRTLSIRSWASPGRRARYSSAAHSSPASGSAWPVAAPVETANWKNGSASSTSPASASITAKARATAGWTGLASSRLVSTVARRGGDVPSASVAYCSRRASTDSGLDSNASPSVDRPAASLPWSNCTCALRYRAWARTAVGTLGAAAIPSRYASRSAAVCIFGSARCKSSDLTQLNSSDRRAAIARLRAAIWPSVSPTSPNASASLRLYRPSAGFR